MPDQITAKGSDVKFTPHPEGQFVAQCVDAIDLGEKVEDYPGTPEKLVHKCALVFRTGEKNPETHEFIDIAQEFTVSMGEKANLRKALESWRGKPYSEAQIEEGVPIHKLTSNWALLTIAQKRSNKGRTYAFIQSIVGVPVAMRQSLPQFPSYTRADYWQSRKDDYMKAASAFRTKYAAPPSDADDAAFADDDDSSLPF